MGVPVLIMGESGSGKTYSLKHFDTSEAAVFSVEKGRLPFKKDFTVFRHATYESIGRELLAPKFRTYIIDDSQYLLANQLFDGMNERENNFELYKKIALRFRNLIHYINRSLADDVVVYFLHHTEMDSNSGRIKAKTVGRMLDQQLTVEGCFDVVLLARTDGGSWFFVTQSDGNSTCKSPEGMFPSVAIANNLKEVDGCIRSYYGLG